VDEDDDGVGETKLPHQEVDWFPLTNRKKDILSDPLLFVFMIPLFLVAALILYTFLGRKKTKKEEKDSLGEGISTEEQDKDDGKLPVKSPPDPPKEPPPPQEDEVTKNEL
jgi:hypothetical protein